jgi:hypothetical protein
MEQPQKHRVLLAGPTILYFPIYLAWMLSSELAQSQIQFWTPPDNPTAGNTSDDLMKEFLNQNGKNDILLCVGDLLRAFQFLKDEGRENEWTPSLLCSTFINKLPMVAYKIVDGSNSTLKPTFMCHKSPFTSFEVADFISDRGTSATIFGEVAVGYERIYVNSVYKEIQNSRSATRPRRSIYLIAPQTFIPGSFDIPVEEDQVITKKIDEMTRYRKFLLTSIMMGNSPNEHLRKYFLDKIHEAIELTIKDPQAAANEFRQHVGRLNKFGHMRVRELTEVITALSENYKMESAITKSVLNGLTAAAYMRYNVKCSHRLGAACQSCGDVSEARKPFAEAL